MVLFRVREKSNVEFLFEEGMEKFENEMKKEFRFEILYEKSKNIGKRLDWLEKKVIL